MKKLKKILSVVLTLAMVLGMSVTTWAAEGVNKKVGTSDDTGKIVIENVEPNVTVELYKIIEATYDANKNFSGYAVTNGAYETILKGTEDKVDFATLANIDAAKINSLGAAKVDDTKVTATFDYTTQNASEVEPVQKELGRYTCDSLGVGMYLVVLSGAESTIYNYAVASIYYTVEGNDNVIVDGDTAGKALNILDATIVAKASDHPTVEKTAKENGTVTNSVDIGDKVDYEVVIEPVPYYAGSNPVLKVEDTLSDGLSLDTEAGIVVTAFKQGQETEGTTLNPTIDLKETTPHQKIKVDFVENGAYLLNEYAGGKVVIKYSAILNKNAGINEVGNGNDVVLTYAKDSKVEGNEGTDEDKTFTYTFDIDGGVNGSTSITEITSGILTKTGEDGPDITIGEKVIENVLEGAEFTLYTVNPDTFTATDDDTLENHKYTNKVFGGTVTSKGNGQLPIYGLAEGTYYLKETKAPDGYSLNTHVFEIKIEASYHEEADKDKKIEIGQLKSWTITIDGKTTNTFTVEHKGEDVVVKKNDDNTIKDVTIANTKLSSLPSTGGIGTTIFTIGGCAIMILAAGLYFASRRKSAK